jgi:hypothetical protein
MPVVELVERAIALRLRDHSSPQRLACSERGLRGTSLSMSKRLTAFSRVDEDSDGTRLQVDLASALLTP